MAAHYIVVGNAEFTEREARAGKPAGLFLAVPGHTFSRHPEMAAHFARPSKDGSRTLVADPSRLGMKNAEHLRMTAVLFTNAFP